MDMEMDMDMDLDMDSDSDSDSDYFHLCSLCHLWLIIPAKSAVKNLRGLARFARVSLFSAPPRRCENMRRSRCARGSGRL